MVNLSDLYDQDKIEMDDWDSSIPQNEGKVVIENFQTMLKRKLEITVELEKCQTQRAMLEKENEYLMATLHDIGSGLDALNWHITVVNSTPEYYPGDPAFLEAWTAIKITQTEIRNIIDEWESKWVSPDMEIPF
jgi:hypothetical protein